MSEVPDNIKLLKGDVLDSESGSSEELIHIFKGDYLTVLQNSDNIFCEFDPIDPNNFTTDQPSWKLLYCSIALLNAFVQINFTGPHLVIKETDLSIPTKWNTSEILARDGEPLFSLTDNSELLVAALSILRFLFLKRTQERSHPFSRWWYARALVTQQSMLNGLASSIHDEAFDCLDGLLEEFSSEQQETLAPVYFLELAKTELVYGYETKAARSLTQAKDLNKFLSVFTGVKGKRTKFQTFESTQLVYLAKSKASVGVENKKSSVPQSLDLNSDLFLEKLKLSVVDGDDIPSELKDIDPNNPPALEDLDSASVLMTMAVERESNSFNNPLVQEEVLAMANRLIESPKGSVNWSIFSRALWERSLAEAKHAKTVERGTLQIQSLVDEYGHASSTSFIPKAPREGEKATDFENADQRMRFIYLLMPLPKWAMDVALAEQYMSLGVLRSALEVYERLQMWGEVALCYAAVDQEDKGIKLLEEHLQKDPKDARGWSILGDITKNIQYWQKSWEVGRYPASRRSLAKYYYSPPSGSNVERDLGKAIKYLHDSLQVNPINLNAWFLYGVCGLETEQYELAAEAFTRCVNLEDDNPRAWSNLATALLQLNKQPEAFKALKMAVRSANERKDWKIWYNYIHVAVGLGDFTAVLHGTKEYLSIKGAKEGENAIDVDVINRIVGILVSSDYEPEKLNGFQRSAIALLTEQVPALITSRAEVWSIVAKVHIWMKRPWDALQDYEKGFRIYTHLPDVEENEEAWKNAVDYCLELVDAYINLGHLDGRIEGQVVCPDWKFKARSAIRVLMGKGKSAWEGTDSFGRLETAKEELQGA